ncbi:unnamed protein product [Rotaria socialis]|uniref:Uncharacterized protein n=1 Tax=Rotaria socialis TaxID=392032 RepID=A0A817W0R1_9BILA|nr:unnamed protein product [Rotaria socialis]CAF4456849.1 unnamed protein product [Rotaria socialis]
MNEAVDFINEFASFVTLVVLRILQKTNTRVVNYAINANKSLKLVESVRLIDKNTMTSIRPANTASSKRRNAADELEENSKDAAILSDSKKQKLEMTMEKYDKFLKEKKDGRFKRTGTWGGLHKRIAHECCDLECARKWAPSPEQCLTDDYYCPSCVLHHRNNMNRFSDERLKWTANVPNTFYLFSLIDPGTGNNDGVEKSLIKFGRTQHENALKRKLITTTKIENWWKEQAEEKKWFVRFSKSDFHGQTECVQIDDRELAQMIAKSKEIALAEEDIQQS